MKIAQGACNYCHIVIAVYLTTCKKISSKNAIHEALRRTMGTCSKSGGRRHSGCSYGFLYSIFLLIYSVGGQGGPKDYVT